MANVPIYNQQVGTDAPGVPTPQIQDLPQAAAGMNINEAQAGLGKQVQEFGSEYGRSVLYTERINAQNSAHEKLAAASDEIHEKAKGENGWLTRLGSNAIGITHGTDPQKIDPDSLDGYIPEWKARYMKDASPYERKLLERGLDTIHRVMQNAVIGHEAAQRKVATEQSENNHFAAISDMAATASKASDVSSLIQQAQEITEKAAIRKGTNPESDDGKLSLKLVKTKTADELAVTAIKANMDRDPAKAAQLLKELRPQMSGKEATNMDSMMDGKMLDLRTDDAWKRVKYYKDSDGNMDMGAIDSKVQRIVSAYPVHQREHIIKEVMGRARLANSEFKDQREDEQRRFDNESITIQQKGISIEGAKELLFKSGHYGHDAADLRKKTKQLEDVYLKSDDVYDRMAEHWNKTQQLTFKQITDSQEVSDKFPDRNDKQQFLDSLKQQFFEQHIQKPADMQRVFNENMKIVPTGQPGLFRIFGGKTDAYYKVAQTLQQNQALVKAVGGTDAAYLLAQRLGGLQSLAVDTPQSKAIMILRNENVPTHRITQDSIDDVIKNYPDLVK